MPVLTGFLQPTYAGPAFLIPLFVDSGQSNHLFLQKIDDEDRIADFEKLSHDEQGPAFSYMGSVAHHKFVRDSALWAFKFATDDIFVGAAQNMIPRLLAALQAKAFAAFPMLAYEVAAFCELEEVQKETILAADAFLRSESEISADVWRDSTVLLPAIKRECSQKWRGAEFREQLKLIRASTGAGKLTIELPSYLFKETRGRRLPATRQLAQYFGIEVVNFQQGSAIREEVSDELQAIKKRTLSLGSYRRAAKPYLDKLRKQLQFTKTLVNRVKPNDIDSIYVAAKVRHRNEQYTDREFLQFALDAKRIFLSGAAGSGKTILLKQLCKMLLSDARGRVPLFLEIRHVNARSADLSIVTLLHHVLEIATGMDFSTFEAGLERGYFCLLLDGLDEVDFGRRQALEEQIIAFERKYSKTPIILSGRMEEAAERFRGFLPFRMEPLDVAQILGFIRNLDYDEAIKRKFEQQFRDGDFYEKNGAFLSSPLLLQVLLISFDHFGKIPTKRSLVLEQAFETTFYKHDALKDGFRRHLRSELALDDFKRVLGAFAFISVIQRKAEFSSATLDDLLEKAAKISGTPASVPHIKEDLLELLLMTDGAGFTFVHRSFQEYFAAYFVTSSGRVQADALLTELSRLGDLEIITLVHQMDSGLVDMKWALPKIQEMIAVTDKFDVIVDPFRYIDVFYENVLFDLKSEILVATSRRLLGSVKDTIMYLYPEECDRLEGTKSPENSFKIVHSDYELAEEDRSELKSLSGKDNNLLSNTWVAAWIAGDRAALLLIRDALAQRSAEESDRIVRMFS